MAEGIEIREASVADVAFIAGANAAMALETERKSLDRATLMSGVAAVFARPERGFYLIAQREGRPAGCLMVTREWSDWRNGEWWWLQSVYVVPEDRRTGVFRALYRAIEKRARSGQDVVGLRLYVELENSAAQATYAQLGMQRAQYGMYVRTFQDDRGA